MKPTRLLFSGCHSCCVLAIVLLCVFDGQTTSLDLSIGNLISSAQYDTSLPKENYRWISSHEASRVDAAPQT